MLKAQVFKKSHKVKAKRPGKAAAFAGSVFLRKPGTHAGEKAISSKSGIKYQSKVQALQDEIDILTSYASDTIYRLHYKTMKYEYVSPAIKNLLGFTSAEMKKLKFRSLILETRIVTNGLCTVNSFDDLEAARRKGDVNKWQADYLIRTKDGRKIWISDVSYPWFDNNGTIIGSIGSLRDITDRVEAENRVKEELERVANIDALTGTCNRREFFTSLDRELKRINRAETDVSILLIDVDHFKRINDSYGHDVGDMVLIEITKIIETCLRETDILARISGEEFGVLLPETSSQGAFWVGERIRTSVLKHEFISGSDRKPIGCSVSVGVASAAPGEKKKSSDLYKIADTRLYIAKNTGRNQVSVDEILNTH